MSGTGGTSFHKNVRQKVISIPGTKPSIHNSQLLVSSGIPSFDAILGGGLPVGSILLIEEDESNFYHKLFLKFYLSEGITNGHFVHLASLDDDPQKLFNNLPGARDNVIHNQREVSDEKLKIAWRYQKNTFEAGNGEYSIPNFEIRRRLEIENYTNLTSAWDESYVQQSDNGKLTNPLYWSLLTSIQKKIKEHNLLPSPSKVKSNLLRIAIHSLVSPFWDSEDSQSKEDKLNCITKFFILLKSIVRSSFSVVLVTVPSHMISEQIISRLYGIVDFGIRLESFVGSEKEANTLYKEHDGLVHIKKLPAINTMVPIKVLSYDWAFSLKRKTLSIKTLHLPPDLSETASRSQQNFKESSCSGKLPKQLDF